MKTHTIAFVCFIAAALAVAAILLTSRSTNSPAPAAGVGQPVLPALTAKLNDVTEVQIQKAPPAAATPGAASTVQTFTFRRSDAGGGWTLAEKDNYPVKAENIRALLIGLSELKTVEPKTSRPDLYPKIGVQDPGAASAEPAPAANPEAEPPTQPSLISAKDASGADLGAVIIGSQKWSGGTTPEIYIRRKGETQSWLATGKVDVPWEALAWVERSIVNIPREKWKSITVTHPDGETVAVMRADATQATFALESVPAGRELTSPTAGESLGGIFTGLTLDDVKTSSALDPAALAAAPRTVGTTFDGLILTARTIELDGKKWSVLEAAAANPSEQPDAAKQAGELNAKLSGWAFAIPDFKSKSLLTRWNDLLKPLAPPTPPAAAPTDAPAEPVDAPASPESPSPPPSPNP